MPACPKIQSDSIRHLQLAESREALPPATTVGSVDYSGQQVVAVLLVAVILALVTAPALVASLSLLDAQPLNRTLSWGLLPPYLYLGPLGSTAALAGMVARTKEDQ
jgi:hypothetical protein